MNRRVRSSRPSEEEGLSSPISTIMVHPRFSSADLQIGKLNHVGAFPRPKSNIVDFYLHDTFGRQFRAAVNGEVMEGEDVLAVMHEGVARSKKPPFQVWEQEMPGPDDDPIRHSKYYGLPVHGRPSARQMKSSAWPR